MKRTALVFLFILSSSLGLHSATAAGFKMPLVDDQLSTWHVEGCRTEVQGKKLMISGQGRLRSVHPYENFALRFEWFTENDRCPVEVHYYVRPDGGEESQPRLRKVRLTEEGTTDIPSQLRPVRDGQWNSLELVVRGGRHKLQINDQPVWDVASNGDQSGFIDLVMTGRDGQTCKLRKITIRELDHQALFNGQDLTGWEGGGADASLCWKVEDGLLLCTGAQGPWLRSLKQYGDFNLRLQYRLMDGGNSGVYVRVPEDGSHHGDGNGVEVQILDDGAARYRNLEPYQFSGSIYKIAPAAEHVSRKAGQWNALEIDCHGTHYRIIHNGITIMDADAESFPELARRAMSGYLGLQNHKEEVYFRYIRLAEN